MTNIIGKIKKVIYHNSENGFIVAVFNVEKTDVNDSYHINIVGCMPTILDSFNLSLTGNFAYNQKYNNDEFKFVAYEEVMPTDTEKIINFLCSDIIKGCGKKSAEKLVNKYKLKTLEKLKNIENILKVPGVSEKNAIKINDSILKFSEAQDTILALQNLNFTIEESSKIYNTFKDNTLNIVEENFYLLKDIIYFKKLDSIYLLNHDHDDYIRLKACVLETMKRLSDNDGHVFYTVNMIKNALRYNFNLYISVEDEEIFNVLEEENEIVIENNYIYLTEYYDAEVFIAEKLKAISKKNITRIKDFDQKISEMENLINIEYHHLQKEVIKSALENNVTIISGGPGTGKTTILNSIVKMYIEENKIGSSDIPGKIALLSPTGRASKKMSFTTGYSAYTIHRFLKWNKDTDTFEHNEDNKVCQNFIIIDECSMIDIKLFTALLKSLKNNVKLVLVGDIFQLPPVGAGLVFNHIIDSDMFDFTSLTKIYRQSDNSFIPDLAYSIKMQEVSEFLLEKKDDYNFIECDESQIKNCINHVILAAKMKKIDETDIQVLVPVYKGNNGIDIINDSLRTIFNPASFDKAETEYNNIIFREKDKVMQLSNDIERNIFNGDIGFISKIEQKNNKTTLTIKFEDAYVTVEKPYLKDITHAYAISIHKSQGSEFQHVIMPISKDYYNMMYNKLIYTGVSRAKKSLTLVGTPNIFNVGINNNKDSDRNSKLKDRISGIILEK